MKTAETPRELVALGYRPVVLDLMSQGAGYAEIVAILDESYGLRTDRKVVSAVARQMGFPVSGHQAIAISVQKEISQLRQEALVAYTEFKDLYLTARSKLTFARDEAIEEMQFAADQFGKWWDRISRFYPLANTPPTSPANSILNVIIAETQKGSLTPESFERIINQLEPTHNDETQEASTQAAPPPEEAEGTGGDQHEEQGVLPAADGHDREPAPVEPPK